MPLNKPTGDMLNAAGSATPANLGTAAAGTSTAYSREDHVHAMPTAADVGAVTTTELANYVATSQLGALSGVAQLDGAGKLRTAQIPALTTSQLAQITPAGIGAVSTSAVIAIDHGGTGAITAAAARTSLGITPSNIGAVATGDIIAISNGGTGSTTASDARTALGITPANIGAIATSQLSSLATLTAGTLTTTQVAALTGDVTSTAGNPATTVVKLQGNSVSNTTPSSGQALVWSGSAWAPATVSGGGGGGANGLTYYLNQNTAPDAPTTGLPTGVKQLGRNGEVAQTQVTSATLTQNVWTTLASFISESTPIDPDVTSIPAGLWDFNIWALGTANQNSPTSMRVVVSIYNGSALTTLGTSSTQNINTVSAQYGMSVLVPQTTVSLTDRIFVAVQVMATGNGHTATGQFGDSTPSHVHTSLPLVGGTGLWKTVDGTVQSPASLLVDADVASNAAIANSKIAGLAASATTDTTNANNITSGTLSTAQLATVSGLPTGAQGSATVIPSVTVDSKGRVTALTTSQLASYVLTSDLTTAATANKVPQLDGAGKLSTAQVPALTTSQIAQITPTGIGAVATSQLTTLATANGVPQLDNAGKLSTAQVPALTATQIAQITPSGIGAVATSALTTAATANGVPQLDSNGALSTAQLATISNLPTGAVGSSSVVPVVTVDTKGRVTALTTAQISGLSGVSSFSAGTTGLTPSTGTTGAVTLAGTLGVGSGGTGSGNASDALTNLGIGGFRYIEGMQTVAVGVSGVTATSMTVTATGVFTTSDSYTPVVGDVIVFTNQATGTQNGPWTLTTVGSTGVSAVFTRPSWFAGTVRPATVICRFGTSRYHTGFNVVATTPSDITVGTSSIAVYQIFARSATNAVIASNTFSGIQTFATNSATGAAPFKFGGNGTGLNILTIPHQAEWDGKDLYITPSASTQTATFTGSISGTTLTVTGTPVGQILVGMTITGGSIASNTYISAGPSAGGAGTYTVSISQTVSSLSITGTLYARRRVSYVDDIWTVNASAMANAAVINFDTETQDVLYYTGNATGNGIINVRGSSTISLALLMAIGQSRTVVFINTNGATPYAPTVQVDGTLQTVKWANGTSTGNASSTDMISLTIVKTAATPTYSVFGSITKFA